MIHLEDGKETYNIIANGLQEIEESIKYVREAGEKLCLNTSMEKNALGNFITHVSDLRLSMKHFNQFFEDFMMEIQEAERLIWEEEQSKIEGEYYEEGYNSFKE